MQFSKPLKWALIGVPSFALLCTIAFAVPAFAQAAPEQDGGGSCGQSCGFSGGPPCNYPCGPCGGNRDGAEVCGS